MCAFVVKMRKNGSRLISIQQYRATDLFIFALILAAFELINFFAVTKWFADSALFTFSLMVPICVLIMMRWGWPAVLYAAGDGALYCLLLWLQYDGLELAFDWYRWLQYGLGNACIAVLLVYFRFVGKERVRGSALLSVLSVVIAWVAVMLGRAAFYSVCAGYNFGMAILDVLASDFLSLAVGIVVILIMRRLDGMFEDQKSYLKRVDRERKEKMRRDTFGDEPVEIDEESFNKIYRDNDIYL